MRTHTQSVEALNMSWLWQHSNRMSQTLRDGVFRSELHEACSSNSMCQNVKLTSAFINLTVLMYSNEKTVIL